jgi:hypothetical protein
MAFPGTYNFSYYKGDTFEFRIYPKDSSGNAFDLEEYDNELGPIFTISTARGEAGAENQIECFASISNDYKYILCAVTPENGEELNAGTTYLYDVQISKTSIPYDIVYTLLTGSITVTDHITGVVTSEES